MARNNEFETEQERFWADEFGEKYIDRNRGREIIASNISLFSKVFARATHVHSIIEFGSNIGLNLIAIHQLLPDAELSAVEINAKAVKELKKIDYIKQVYHTSILNFSPSEKYDFVFTSGVLIHISPEKLQSVYRLLYNASRKYIFMNEYYNPTPVSVDYRGHKEKLFKRDFAGELMDIFPNLRLLDYGFSYHRDPSFAYGDGTWFLLEKNEH